MLQTLQGVTMELMDCSFPVLQGKIHQVHFNLFITRFVITQFLIKHGSKMDPRNV